MESAAARHHRLPTSPIRSAGDRAPTRACTSTTALLDAEQRADLRADVAARRPRERAARGPAATSPPRAGIPARARRPRRERRAPRLSQRVPPPCLAAAERRRPVQGRDPLPLPRLDLSLRRHADRRPGGPRVRRAARQVPRSACCRSASRSCAAWCSSTSTTTPRRWPTWSATSRSGSQRYRIPTLRPLAPGGGSQPANWKVVVENYIEGYHIPIAHPGLMRMLDYKNYDVEVHEHYVWFEAPMRSQAEQQPARAPLRAARRSRCPGWRRTTVHVWRYVFLYPNTTIDLYPDQVNTWQMLPNGVGRTRDVFAQLPAAPAASPRTRAGPVDQPAAEQPRARRGHRPGRERPAGAADPRLRVRAAVAARGRGGVVRRPDPRRPRAGARSATRERTAPRPLASGSSPRLSGRSPSEGIDGVRIARIAMAAGVSTSLVHYHFDSRDALLAEALDYSYAHAGDARISSGELPASSHAERLQSMIDQCLPTSEALRGRLGAVGGAVAAGGPQPGAADGRRGALRPTACLVCRRDRGRGRAAASSAACDPDQVADLALALLDGYGIRTLIGDSAVSIERARREVAAALAGRLGLGEWLVGESAAQTGEPAPSAARAAARPVRTAPSM